MALPSLNLPDARRMRSYFLRLPLATRSILFLLIAFYIAQLIWPGLEDWGALIPQEININTLYRLNTYPLLHRTIFHLLFNTLALIPLLERFESEHGTIVTFSVFSGTFGLLPGGLYTLLEKYAFHHNSAALGSSVWVFLLLAHEAIKQYRIHPHFTIATYRIPTWITPLAGILVISFLVPHTSFLGHLCGAAVGYLWGLGYIRFLAPPDKVLRWIEGKLNLLGRLPHYVSVDQTTYGRYGVLPTTNMSNSGNNGRVGGPVGGRGGILEPVNGGAVGAGNGSIGTPSTGQRLGP